MTTQLNLAMLRRMTNFGILVCKIVDDVPNRASTFILVRQLVRSSTSIGANYREAQFARTTKEFLSKLQIALQEAEETRHWLITIQGAGAIPEERVKPLIDECTQIIAILVASVKATRRRTGL